MTCEAHWETRAFARPYAGQAVSNFRESPKNVSSNARKNTHIQVSTSLDARISHAPGDKPMVEIVDPHSGIDH